MGKTDERIKVFLQIREWKCRGACARVLPAICFLALISLSGFVHAFAGGPESRSVEVKSNSLFPSAELFVGTGESVTFLGTDTQLTIKIRNSRGAVRLPASINAKNEKRDLIFTLRKGDKIAVLFFKTGDYPFTIDGLNPGLAARKCGVDVLPHSVEGLIHVLE